jgi:hypothetical protein
VEGCLLPAAQRTAWRFTGLKSAQVTRVQCALRVRGAADTQAVVGTAGHENPLLYTSPAAAHRELLLRLQRYAQSTTCLKIRVSSGKTAGPGAFRAVGRDTPVTMAVI